MRGLNRVLRAALRRSRSAARGMARRARRSCRSRSCSRSARALGREFMPKLEEGNFWIRATLPTSISLEQSAQVRRPHARASSSAARGRTPCTASGPHASRDRDGRLAARPPRRRHRRLRLLQHRALRAAQAERRVAHGRDQGEADRGALAGAATRRSPASIFNFSQVISDNVEEAMSGVKGENTVKVIGPDLQRQRGQGRRDRRRRWRRCAASSDLGMFHSLGQPNVRITPDRDAVRPLRPQRRRRRARWCRRRSAARRSPRSTRARSTST